MNKASRLAVIATVMILMSCHHRIPLGREYPPGWMREDHPVARVQSLTGTVYDASGAERQFVLVERVTSDLETRLDATLTNEHGQFHLRARGRGPFYLRFRLLGFNDYVVPVEVESHAPARLQITLTDSD